MSQKHSASAGFTIIELMIATIVYSVILLVISGAIVQIGRLYYKGITESHTQEATRTIIDAITQSIQFSSGDITGTTNLDGSPVTVTTNIADSTGNSRAVCIGNDYFMYRLGQQLESPLHALTRQSGASCATERAQDMRSPVGITGTELLGEHMRLANLAVDPISATSYKVLVRVVYGDDDLLCTDSTTSPNAIPCQGTDTLTDTERATRISRARDLRCKNIRSGGQFCAESELSTIVERRL